MGALQITTLAVLMLTGFQRCTSMDQMKDIKTDCGYVQVRPNAFMFWLLYFQDNTFAPDFLTPLDPIPVVVWLQGGPGASGVGYGNFEELGPLFLNLTRRPTSWTGLAHVLFIDSPVGSGYSYVTDNSAYATDIDQAGLDMVELLKGFYEKTGLQNSPLYIFCESYGGKMAAVFGREVAKAVKAGNLTSNLKGVGLGDAWISPMDSVNTWGQYLYQASLLDKAGLQKVERSAAATQRAVDDGEWVRATQLWYATEIAILQNTDNVDFYNILYPHHSTSTRMARNITKYSMSEFMSGLYALHVAPFAEYSLSGLMNGPFKDYLEIIPESVIWGGQSNDVFSAMNGDFMKPTIDIVDQNIADDIKVVVYNGMLDLIVDTPGQEQWVAKLEWDKVKQFTQKRWKPRYYKQEVDTGGYSKDIDNFSFWWVINAGHMVPTDQGEFMLYIIHDTVVKTVT